MGMEKGSGLNFGPYDYNGGGGNPQPPTPTPQGEYFVKVIDYDGTVLDEQWLDDGAEYTLPSAPSHEGLVFQEWSSSETITDGKITIDKNNVMVGAIYTTVSGANEFDVEVNANTGLSVTLNIYGGTKDWGDGTTDTNTSHTYSQAGKYTIKATGTSMSSSSNSGGFGQKSYEKNYWCTAIRLATLSPGYYAFQYCENLKYISLPKEATSISDHLCYSCNSLKSIIIPSGVTTINTYSFSGYSLENIVIPKGVTSIANSFSSYSLKTTAIPKTVTSLAGFSSCYSLTKIIIPNSVTTINQSAFGSCYCLHEITIPNGVTTIGQSAFSSCYTLSKIVIPSSVTSIGSAAFQSCAYIQEYDFSSATAIPTLDNSSAIPTNNKLMKIKVPSALYDQWITETNWSALANYIVAV